MGYGGRKGTHIIGQVVYDNEPWILSVRRTYFNFVVSCPKSYGRPWQQYADEIRQDRLKTSSAKNQRAPTKAGTRNRQPRAGGYHTHSPWKVSTRAGDWSQSVRATSDTTPAIDASFARMRAPASLLCTQKLTSLRMLWVSS